MKELVYIIKKLPLILCYFVLTFSILCGGNFQILGPLTLRHLSMIFLFIIPFYIKTHSFLQYKRILYLYMSYLFLYCFFNLINGEFFTHKFLQSIYTYHMPCLAVILGFPRLINNIDRLQCFTYSLIFLYLFDVLLTVLQFSNSNIAWTIATYISDSANEGMEAAEMYSNTSNSLLGYSLVAGVFGFVVTNGYFLATYLPVLTNKIYKKTFGNIIISLILFIIGIIAIFFTQQRMAFISLILYILLFLVIEFKKYSFPLVCIVAILTLFLLDFNNLELGRITSNVNDGARIRLFANFSEFINSDAFWYGGAGAFLEKYQKAQHNTFLSAWVLGGVFTFICYCLLYINLLLESIKRIYQRIRETEYYSFTISYAVSAILFLFYSLTHSAGVQNGAPMFWTLFIVMLTAEKVESNLFKNIKKSIWAN